MNVAEDHLHLEFERFPSRTTSTRPRSPALRRRILARATNRPYDHVDASSYEPPMEDKELLYTIQC